MVLKRIFLLVVVLVLVPLMSYAKKTKYVASNQRFNFVSIVEISSRAAEEKMMTHPVTLDIQKIAQALKSVYITKKNFASKNTHVMPLFNESAVEYLSENFAKAFSQASSSEEINFSYLMKEPLVILRNDRLVIGTAWIHENQLNLKFSKLWALVLGDVDKRGGEREAIQKSRGLRVALKEGPGQKLIGHEGMVIDLNAEYTTPSTELSSETKANETAEERLAKLNRLKKKGLISESEYQEKRKEILNGL